MLANKIHDLVQSLTALQMTQAAKIAAIFSNLKS